MLIPILLLLLGFAILLKSADCFVDGASSLAKKLAVSEIIIGLTVVAFGTSAPELVVNVLGSINKNPGISFGNVVGSSIFNIFFILGIAGVIRPIASAPNTIWKEIPMAVLAAAILLVIGNDQFIFGSQFNSIAKNDGIILLVFFAFFLFYIFRIAKVAPQEATKIEAMSWGKTSLYTVGGLLGLILGGHLVVTYSVQIAQHFGLSEKLIGLTIVSIGTSLPELATSAVAAYKGKNDIAMGNIIGSNIFNIFFILGISVIINPIYFTGQGGVTISSANIDMIVLVVASILLFLTMFTGKKRTIDRWEAVIFLILFVAYNGYLIYQK